MSESMTNRSYEAFDVSEDGGVVDICLKGPGKGNALGPAFWRELPLVFDEIDRDVDVHAVLMRGAGKHFSVGLDLMAAMGDVAPLITGGDDPLRRRTALHRLIRDWQNALDSVAACRKPVVAAIQGWCIGGGLDLVSACDVRVCASGAKFSLREVKLAIVADVGSLQRLPHIIGEGHARELALTGRDIDAQTALSMGLVTRVLDDNDKMLADARNTVREIASNPPLVVQGIKQVMNRRTQPIVREGLEYVATWNSAFLQSDDLAEAFSAFAERREPNYKGS